ncbi:MAG: hypothetical protein KF866_07185 [Phycisphaeraceae bacterium]|nr:hypothetical protein [Phycisphaeraceae bacterium]MCW5755370.1 hypothetical protein [Phycisphaeraceae bacterium]
MADSRLSLEIERLIVAAAEPPLHPDARSRLEAALQGTSRPSRRDWVLALAAGLALAGGLALWIGVGPRAANAPQVAEVAAPMPEPNVVHVRAEPFLKSTRAPGLDISRWEAR